MTNSIHSGYAKGGTLTESSRKPCQDKYFCKQDSDFIYLSVADGASSARYSHIGARLATKQTYNLLKEHFDEYYTSNPFYVKRTIVEFIKTEFRKIALEKKVGIKEFATTFLFVAIKGDMVISGHIGDGLIAYRKHKKLKILSPPINGEFLNETYFVTSRYFLYHFRIYRGNIKGISQFILMTDGVTGGYYNRKSNQLHDGFDDETSKLDFRSKFNLDNSLRNLMLKKICRRTHDDCCLVIANFM